MSRARRSACFCSLSSGGASIRPLSGICRHVTEVGQPLKFGRPALNFVMQGDGDFVDVILLYLHCF